MGGLHASSQLQYTSYAASAHLACSMPCMQYIFHTARGMLSPGAFTPVTTTGLHHPRCLRHSHACAFHCRACFCTAAQRHPRKRVHLHDLPPGTQPQTPSQHTPSAPLSNSDIRASVKSVADALNHEQADRLVIAGVLGTGTFGTVYSGVWRGLKVAVKTGELLEHCLCVWVRGRALLPLACCRRRAVFCSQHEGSGVA